MSKIERALYERLQPDMEEIAFEWKKSWYGFYRQEQKGFSRYIASGFHTVDNNLNDIYKFEVSNIARRNDEVEDIVNTTRDMYDKASEERTVTVFRGLGFFPFNPNRDGHFEIRYSHIEEDIEIAAANIMDMMRTDGYQWFERYGSLLECSRGINDPEDGHEAHPLFNNTWGRMYHGIAAAALVEPERVPGLVRKYTDHAKAMIALKRETSTDRHHEAEGVLEKLPIMLRAAKEQGAEIDLDAIPKFRSS